MRTPGHPRYTPGRRAPGELIVLGSYAWN